MIKKKDVLIFTGGHHSGSLPIADWYSDKCKIIWFGHKYSMWRDINSSAEYREVTSRNYEFIDLKAGKFYRTKNPLMILRIPFGFLQAFMLLLRLKLNSSYNCRGIVTFGGYLGVPVVIAGWILGIPVIAHEQTLSIGFANKIIQAFALKVAYSWEQSHLHNKSSKFVLTGIPLRPEIIKIKNQLNIRQNDLIYVTGGKQGSHFINSLVFDSLKQLLPKYRLIHQTGNNSQFNDYYRANKIKQELPNNLKSKYQVSDYLDVYKAGKFLSTSTLVISRSGAHTTQELAYFNTKSVLIPLPKSSNNEQLLNAELLEKNNLSVILNQENANTDSLLEAIQRAINLRSGEIKIVENGLENMVKLIDKELFA